MNVMCMCFQVSFDFSRGSFKRIEQSVVVSSGSKGTDALETQVWDGAPAVAARLPEIIDLDTPEKRVKSEAVLELADPESQLAEPVSSIPGEADPSQLAEPASSIPTEADPSPLAKPVSSIPSPKEADPSQLAEPVSSIPKPMELESPHTLGQANPVNTHSPEPTPKPKPVELLYKEDLTPDKADCRHHGS